MVKYTHLAFCLLLSCRFLSASYHSPRYVPSYLEDAVTVALSDRNQQFRMVIPDTCGIDAGTWSSDVQSAVMSRCTPPASRETVWNCFLYGLMLKLQNKGSGEPSFIRALDYADGDAAQTFLLFIEFNRYGLKALEDSSLNRLEKALYRSGAVTSSLIASHFVHFGIERKKNGRRDDALEFFELAHRFNRLETASIRETFLLGIPFNVSLLLSAAGSFFTTLSASWQVQLAFVSTLFGFIMKAGTLFIIIVTLIFCLKYFPKALHRLIHLYPATLSISLRTWLVSVIFFSLLSFGFYPFFWVAAFMIKPLLDKKERVLGGILLIMILIAPGISLIKQRLDFSRISEYPLSRFSESVHEMPNAANLQPSSTAIPLLLSSAITALKHGSTQTARQFCSRMLPSAKNDPVVANTLGIMHFLSGEIDSATYYFKKVLVNDPKNLYAFFNLSRCALAANDASGGMDYLKDAAAIHDTYVNFFIQKNDLLFNNDWPPLRQIMFADYSPLYFWKHFLTLSALPADSFTDYWGVSFLGFPPVLSAVLFFILTILLIATGSQSISEKKLKRYLECKYCGKIICRFCTTGILCPTCAAKNRQKDSTTSQDHMRKKLIETTHAVKLLRKSIGNILIPGAGSLYNGSDHFGKSVVLLIGTASCFSLWSSLYLTAPLYSLTMPELLVLALPMSIFQIYMLLQNLPAAINQGKSVISINTSTGVQ